MSIENGDFHRAPAVESDIGLSPEQLREATFEKSRYFVGRHDDAQYQLNDALPYSENPRAHFDKREQPTEDLTEQGVEHAAEMAKVFLANFDPAKDEIAFLASPLTRARQTANIFLEEAKAQGFTTRVISTTAEETGAVSIMSPEDFEAQTQLKVKSVHESRESIPPELYATHGGPDIRTLKALSLDNIKEMFIEYLFQHDNHLETIPHVDKLSPEYKEAWAKARAIIESDNQATWGENFLLHSEAVTSMLRDYKTEHGLSDEDLPVPHNVTDMYQNNFRNMLRLMSRYDEAIAEYENKHEEGKKLRVVGFGHENQLLYFLDKEFDVTGVDKGRVIGFKVFTDEAGAEHFTACLPDHPDDPKEIEFPSK